MRMNRLYKYIQEIYVRLDKLDVRSDELYIQERYTRAK
jgi:hypothetical protein